MFCCCQGNSQSSSSDDSFSDRHEDQYPSPPSKYRKHPNIKSSFSNESNNGYPNPSAFRNQSHLRPPYQQRTELEPRNEGVHGSRQTIQNQNGHKPITVYTPEALEYARFQHFPFRQRGEAPPSSFKFTETALRGERSAPKAKFSLQSRGPFQQNQIPGPLANRQAITIPPLKKIEHTSNISGRFSLEQQKINLRLSQLTQSRASVAEKRRDYTQRFSLLSSQVSDLRHRYEIKNQQMNSVSRRVNQFVERYGHNPPSTGNGNNFVRSP